MEREPRRRILDEGHKSLADYRTTSAQEILERARALSPGREGVENLRKRSNGNNLPVHHSPKLQGSEYRSATAVGSPPPKPEILDFDSTDGNSTRAYVRPRYEKLELDSVPSPKPRRQPTPTELAPISWHGSRRESSLRSPHDHRWVPLTNRRSDLSNKWVDQTVKPRRLDLEERILESDDVQKSHSPELNPVTGLPQAIEHWWKVFATRSAHEAMKTHLVKNSSTRSSSTPAPNPSVVSVATSPSFHADSPRSSLHTGSPHHKAPTLFQVLSLPDASPSLVLRLVKSGADVNQRDDNNNTPLLRACASRCCADVIEILLDHNADIDARNSAGNTALLIASMQSHLEVMRILIVNGADVNCEDPTGRTPLIHCALAGSVAAVGLLLTTGALLDAQDRTGKNVLQIVATALSGAEPKYRERLSEVQEILQVAIATATAL